MIVLKFGGTSVASAELMKQALDIAWTQRERSPLLVSSAITGTTDSLIRIGEAAGCADTHTVAEELRFLRGLHFGVLSEAASDTVYEEGKRTLGVLFDELESLLKGLVLIQEVSPRSHDALVSFGERMSTYLLWCTAREHGYAADLLDSRSYIITDDQYTAANILIDETYSNIRNLVRPTENRILIAQGFIGQTLAGTTTTLGRGGSDYSATIFGAALGAEEVQIWTDVTGIMTTDPRLIPSARTIGEISYEEAAELAYFGAKVIHPSTIQPAVELGIPVWVKNTRAPEAPGTKIHGKVSLTGVQAIASKRGITVITVRSTRMLNAYGFLEAIFSVFAGCRVPVDLVTTSEVSVSVTVDKSARVTEVIEKLSAFSQVDVEPEHAILSVVGSGLRRDGAVIRRVFSALEGIPVRMISLGGSDINLSLVVPQEYTEESVRRLHNALFEPDTNV